MRELARENDRQLILAIDATCRVCERIGRAVAEAGGSRLEVRNLRDDDIELLRVQALGDNPEWAPTLIRRSGSLTRAWTGVGMVLPLVGRLGLRSTWRVLKVLGELRLDGRRAGVLSRPGAGVLTRKQFMLGMTGLFVGASLLTTGRAFASEAAVARSERLTAEAMLARLHDMLARTDVRSVLDPGTRHKLETAKGLAVPGLADDLQVVSYGPGGHTQISESFQADGRCAVLAGADHSFEGGNRLRTGVVVLPVENKLLISRVYDRPYRGIGESAELWQLPVAESAPMTLLSISINGESPRRVGAAETCDECAPRNDGRTPTRTDSYCSATSGYDCIKTGAACAGCLGACVRPNAACFACAAAACPFVFAECCDKRNVFCIACGI